MFNLISLNSGICAPNGFFADGVSAGLKANKAPDLAFIRSEIPCEVAGIFTANKFRAAPILHFLQKEPNFKTNFILINSKNANAMTGEAGLEDINEILQVAQNTAKSKGFALENPLASSTGVIGVRMPKEKICAALSKFDFSAKKPQNAAKAIMTTDRFSKEIAFEVELENGEKFSIGAMCKGAGMICPSLATMLCFITTDAAVPREDMKSLLQNAAKHTFNAISVDGDTSTNDTILLFANAKSGAYNKEAFAFALEKIMHKLATDIVRDGEGSTKLAAFLVRGAKNEAQAQTAAKALSQSLLVKTALFGCDPNWGRIASTIGASGIECDPNTLIIAFNEIIVYEKGIVKMDKEIEAKAAQILQKDEFKIICDIGLGDGEFTAYGCDLGHEYVKINADYRT